MQPLAMPASLPAARHEADWLVVGVALVALFGYSLLETMLAPALPQIRLALHATPAQLGMVFTGLFLAGAVSTPLVGALADIFPKRLVFCATLAIVIAGAALAGTAKRIEILALGQVLQGVGLGIVPLSVGLMAESLPREKLAIGNGLMIAALTSSTALGLLAAGTVIDHFGFRGIYGLALALLTPCGLVMLARSRSGGAPRQLVRLGVDWAGAALLALMLIVLLTGLALGPGNGWASWLTVSLLTGAVVLGVIWIAFERRQARPLLDLSLLALPAVALVCVNGFAVGFASISVYVLVPLLLQAGFHADAGAVGLYMLPMGLGGFVAGLLTGSLERMLGARKALLLGTLILTASVGMLVALRDQGWHIVASMSLLGVGAAIVLTESMNVVVRAVGTARAAGVSGIFFVIRNIGGTVGAQVSATLLGAATTASGVVSTSGYTHAFGVATVVAVLGIVAASIFPDIATGARK